MQVEPGDAPARADGGSRSVAIVGAGPAGTALALGLLRAGYRVTLVSDRSAAEIRAGSVMSSQITFESALDVEQALGISDLLPGAPAIGHMSYDTVRADGSSAAFTVPLPRPARSLDLRVKIPTMLDAVARRGATVSVGSAGVDDVEELAASHDLVVISTGRDGLASLFDIDLEHTPYSAPQRVAALTYLRDVTPDPRGPGLRYHRVEGLGECFTCPAMTVDGPCDIFVVEGVPGGALDCWDDVSTSREHLARLRAVLADHFPAEGRRILRARLADDFAMLRGQITPVVRHPVGILPSGAQVLGMADVVVLNDPVTSQGSNTAVKSAWSYLEAITAHEGVFDAAWMQRTFDNFWRGWAQWVTTWTNSWLQPDRDHQRRAIAAAAAHPAIAARLAAGFDDARLFSPWWFEPDATVAFLEEQINSESARFDPRDLRAALGQYATGVTVVTVEDHEGRRWGMTANSFTSVSLNPPLVLWAAAKSSASLPAFLQATHFAVNVLAFDQHHLSRRFSTSGTEKFDGVDLVPRDQLADPSQEGEAHPPVLAGTVAHFVCRTTQHVDGGDHVVVFGEIESYTAPGGEPLVFHSGAYRLAAKHPDL